MITPRKTNVWKYPPFLEKEKTSIQTSHFWGFQPFIVRGFKNGNENLGPKISSIVSPPVRIGARTSSFAMALQSRRLENLQNGCSKSVRFGPL